MRKKLVEPEADNFRLWDLHESNSLEYKQAYFAVSLSEDMEIDLEAIKGVSNVVETNIEDTLLIYIHPLYDDDEVYNYVSDLLYAASNKVNDDRNNRVEEWKPDGAHTQDE